MVSVFFNTLCDHGGHPLFPHRYPARPLGHGGPFFSATSMIGFIAGAGIVVRNSIILVDFIELRFQEGMASGSGGHRCRSRSVPTHDAHRCRSGGGSVGDSVRSHLPGTCHLTYGRGKWHRFFFSRMTVPVLYFLDKRWETAHLKAPENPQEEDDFSRRICP